MICNTMLAKCRLSFPLVGNKGCQKSETRICAKFAMSLSQLYFDLGVPSQTRLAHAGFVIPKPKSCLDPSTTELFFFATVPSATKLLGVLLTR